MPYSDGALEKDGDGMRKLKVVKWILLGECVYIAAASPSFDV